MELSPYAIVGNYKSFQLNWVNQSNYLFLSGGEKCHILSYENLAKPTFVQVEYNKQFLNTVVCMQPNKNKFRERGTETGSYNSLEINILQRNNVYLCPNRFYVSSFYTCDGYNDCPKSEDEKECMCSIRNHLIQNS